MNPINYNMSAMAARETVKANISPHYKGLNWGTLKGFFANLIKKCFFMGEMIKSSIQFFKVVTAVKYIQI